MLHPAALICNSAEFNLLSHAAKSARENRFISGHLPFHDTPDKNKSRGE